MFPKTLFLSFYLTIQFLPQIFCGHLYSQGVELNYNNAGYATEFRLSFSFSTPFSSTDYLKVIFPFALHSTSTNSIPDNLSGHFSTNSQGFHCGMTQSGLINVYVDSTTSYSYYIQLIDSKGLPNNGLTLGVFYTLVLKLEETNANIQGSGVKTPIQMFTISDMSSNAIIYDSNSVFGTISLNEYPSEDMEIAVHSAQAERNNLSAIYNITLDIFPKKRISDAARFQISFLQKIKGFSFVGICESVARITAPIIEKMDSLIYNCTLDSNNENLILSLGKSLEINMAIRLNITVLNPGFVQQNTSLEVRSMFSYINTIVEINKTEAIFYTLPLSFFYIKLFMAWGLDNAQSSLYPFNINIVRGDSQNIYYPYNSIKWKLKIAQSTTTSNKFQIIINLPSPQNSMILPGSIVHNFPSNSNGAQTARCYVLNLAISSDFKIICDNVGQMSSNIEYFIGCRMYFPYDQWTQPLREFGAFTIYSFINSISTPDASPFFITTKALVQIQTSNNPSWFIQTAGTAYDTTIVSTESSTTATPNIPETNTLGLETSTTNKRLVFTMNMIISDVYTSNPAVTPPTATPAATITYGAGLVIMANPSVYWDGNNAINLEPKGTPTGTPTVNFVKYSTFNKIVISCTHTSQLLAMFAYDTSVASPPANYFSLDNLQIKNQTSLYADDDLLDFYIGSFEQLNTAFPAFRKLMLYNGYTIRTTWASQIRYGIVNYWTTATGHNDGASFPSFLRIAGYFDTNDLTGFNGKLALFFNDLTPFYLYSDNSISDEISCFSSITGAKCHFYPCSSYGNGQSYHNLNRVEIDLVSVPSGPGSAFQILIPIATVTKITKFNLFLGLMCPNTRYSKGNYNKILGIYRLTGGNNLQTNQLTMAYGSALGTSYLGGGATAANYGLDITGLTVGQIDVTLQFTAGHIDGSNAILPNSGIADGNNAAGFTITSTWNFTSSLSVISFTEGSTNADDKCLAGSYIPSWTNGVSYTRYTLFCPYTTGTEGSSSKVSISLGRVPYINGDKLPSDTSFVWSAKAGNLKTYKSNPTSVIPNYGTSLFYSVLPHPQKGFKQNYLQWNFLPSNSILSGFVIKIEFNALVQFSLATGAGLNCELKYANNTPIDMKCVAILTGGNTLSYTISNCNDCPLRVQALQINNWGITYPSPSISDVDIGFYLKIYSSLGNLIETSVLNTFKYNSTAVSNSIILTNLKFGSLNKRSRGPFQFTFYMNGREIWDNEYLVVSLGGVAKDNTLNIQNIRCRMIESNQSVSKRWTSIDLTDLNSITITPKTHINNTNASFTFSCDGVITPYSYNPSYITMFLEILGTSSIIKYGDAINIDDGRFLNQYLFDSVSALLINKWYNSPGSSLQLVFNFTCTNQAIDMDSTNFVMEFPVYYSPTLTNSFLLCQINSIVASCSVTQTRRLVFQYIPINIPQNTQFQLRISGVDCPFEFLSGSSFFFGISPNSSSTNYSQYGIINDISPNSLPLNIQIFSLKVSNLYIRSYSTYSFKVNFPAGSISSTRIITIDFPPQWDLIINYNIPSCQVYNPDLSTQFAANCTSFVNKVLIFLGSSDITSNFYYILVLNNVRNPDNINCDVEPFIISVIDQSYNLISRSHSNQINKNTTSYLKNPNEINLRFVDVVTGEQIEIFQADIGVFNKLIRVVPDYGIFAETLTLATTSSDFGIYPSTVECKFGEKYCQFSIAAVKGTLPGLYNLEILRTENFGLIYFFYNSFRFF